MKIQISKSKAEQLILNYVKERMYVLEDIDCVVEVVMDNASISPTVKQPEKATKPKKKVEVANKEEVKKVEDSTPILGEVKNIKDVVEEPKKEEVQAPKEQVADLFTQSSETIDQSASISNLFSKGKEVEQQLATEQAELESIDDLFAQ